MVQALDDTRPRRLMSPAGGNGPSAGRVPPHNLAAEESLLGAMLLCGLTGVIIERLAYRRLRNAPKLAPLIIATGFTPVYQVTSSCTGVKAVFGSGSDLVITDPAPGPSAKYATYFAADGSSTPCTLGAAGAQVDIGESDIFSTTCDGFGPPGGNVGEFLGPIQAMVFVVPGKSQETAITAEAAREVFGMGGGSATPWTNPSRYFVRNANTGTQQQIGHAIYLVVGGRDLNYVFGIGGHMSCF